MLEDLDYEEIAEKFIDNKLGLEKFRNELIIEDYNSLLNEKKKMDIFIDLEHKYGLQERMLRIIVNGK
jgi:hypothetical protein